MERYNGFLKVTAPPDEVALAGNLEAARVTGLQTQPPDRAGCPILSRVAACFNSPHDSLSPLGCGLCCVQGGNTLCCEQGGNTLSCEQGGNTIPGSVLTVLVLVRPAADKLSWHCVVHRVARR